MPGGLKTAAFPSPSADCLSSLPGDISDSLSLLFLGAKILLDCGIRRGRSFSYSFCNNIDLHPLKPKTF